MQNAEYVPVNFRLSERAAAKLNELTTIASASTSRAMVPALLWEALSQRQSGRPAFAAHPRTLQQWR